MELIKPRFMGDDLKKLLTNPINRPSEAGQTIKGKAGPMDSKTNNDVKWYDKRLMIPSLIIFLILSVLFYSLAMRHKPPEGFVFPREPVISGEYKCCEAGGRYSASWVGATQVRCSPFSYYGFLGRSLDDCGLKAQLNGHPVEVIRVELPSSSAENHIAVRITAFGQTYYDVSDQQIRERWVSESTSGAFLLAFILTLIVHGAFQVYLINFHKPSSSKGVQ